jgi:hypothetical protein
MVMLETRDVTATAGTDYTPVFLPVTFMPGSVYQQVEVAIVDDEEDEPGDEMFQLDIGNALALGGSSIANVIVATPLLSFTIEDNDHTLSASASSVDAGTPLTVQFDQRYDSPDVVGPFARITGGSARPGVDIAPTRRTQFLGPGETTTTVQFETFDGIAKEDRTVTLDVGGTANGTVHSEPETMSVKIRNDDSKFVPATLEYGPGTGAIYYEGKLAYKTELPQESFSIEMKEHVGGSRFTLRQQGTSLTFERVCGDDIDAAQALGSIPSLSGDDMRAEGEDLWRASSTPFTYVLAGDPAKKLIGYITYNYHMDATSYHEQFLAYVVTPTAPEEPEKAEVPRLGPDAQPVVDPGAARDSVARAIAADMGGSAEAIAPYLTTSLSRRTGSSPVEVHLWLGADGQPVQPGRADLGPCDPGYGEMPPAVTRVIYTIHAFEDRFIVQSKTQDVETGRYERAYMEDFDTASNALDEAVGRSQEGLSPDISAPDD